MSEDEDDKLQARESVEIADRMSETLAGMPPELQGAILIQLVATWLGGFHGEGEKEDKVVRSGVLAQFVNTVVKLVIVGDLFRPGTKH